MIREKIAGLTLRWLKTWVQPHAHLHDRDGSLYMGRWRVINEGTWQSRVLERLTGYSSARLHWINRADHDRDLHNHPFVYRTFVLKGSYVEHIEVDSWTGQVEVREVKAGQTAHAPAGHFHRIHDVSEGGVWTLFFMTKNTETWGFHVNGKFVQSTKYLLRKGYPKDSIRGAETP